jgi:hypothetical protein
MSSVLRVPCIRQWRCGVVFGVSLPICWGLLTGCGPTLSMTVPPDLIQRLPKDTRRNVFQAETVVTIAVDRKGTVKRDIENAMREIDRTKEKIAAVKKESAKSPQDERKAELEVEMLEAKIDYQKSVVDHLYTRLKLADKELLLARAQFELEKVKLVKKHAIAFDSSVEDFEEQVKSIQAYVDNFRKDVEEEAAELKKEEEIWLAAKKAYFSSFGESAKGWWTE